MDTEQVQKITETARIRRHHRRGEELEPKLTLMLKFSLVLTLAMMCAILGLGFVLYQRFHGELFEDIKRSGALGVTALATVGEEVLLARSKAAVDMAKIQEAVNATLIPELKKIGGKKTDEQFINRVNGKINEFNRNIQGANKNIEGAVAEIARIRQESKKAQTERRAGLAPILQFLPVGQNTVLNAVITYTKQGREFIGMGAENKAMQFLVTPNTRSNQPLKIRADGTEQQVRGVAFTRGYYKSGEATVPAFKFSKEISNTKGEMIGMAHLTLSAKRVGEIAGRMRESLILSCGVALVCGLILSFLLSALVNRPLKHLLADVKIVAQGELDHHSTVRTSDEVGVLAHAFNQMTISLKSAHRKELESEVLRRDLKVAREVQAHLVPQEMPQLPGLDLTAKYEPARDVGGDAFDLIPLPKDRLGVVIADVSGKGVPGALYMAMTRIAFRVATIYAESPLEVVSMVHQLMSPELTRGRFITAVYMEVDTNSGNVICCRLGHDPILKFNSETEEIESYTPQGAAIGILPTDAFKKKVVQEEFTIQTGDRVLLYTDGITEAANNADEEFGMERIEGFMVENAKLTSDQFVNKLITDVKFFIEDRDIQDDLTVISLALPVAAGAEEAETADRSEAEAPESV